MMATFKNAIILLALSLTAVAAHGGSPDGMSVAAVGSTAAASFTSAVTRFFSDYKRDGIRTGVTPARAGSPDGLSIAAVGNASGAPYTSAIKQFVADHHAHKVPDCSQTMLNVANVYFTNLPPQLTGDLAVAAVNDKAKRKRLGKLLTRFRDATLDHGFDAALAYEVRDGKVRLYGISGDPRDKVLVSSLTLDEAQD
jgi:hypothetical protein